MRLSDVDLADLDNFASGFPHEIFAVHRREAPVSWREPTPHTPDGEGFWSFATYDETLAILREPRVFSSETGGARPYGGTILPDMPVAGKVLNMMDDPRHQRVRRLVSTGFTPRTVRRLEDELRGRLDGILGAVAERGECDFLVEVAAELPMQAVCILLGVPESDRHRVASWVKHTSDFPGSDAFEFTPEALAAFRELWLYGSDLIEAKRARPTDDMLSIVTHATLPDEDPPRLTDEELHLFFSLLFSAGAETTRNAAAGGLLALIQNPDQMALLASDRSLVPAAIEEMVRWTSPAAYNRRTATRDVELGGHQIRPGQKVVFWEASANRDERVFAESMSFRVARSPNPHLGFGHGLHYCLGANLARLEMKLVFERVLDRFSGFALAGSPEWTRSNKHTGLRHLPVRFGVR